MLCAIARRLLLMVLSCDSRCKPRPLPRVPSSDSVQLGVGVLRAAGASSEGREQPNQKPRRIGGAAMHAGGEDTRTSTRAEVRDRDIGVGVQPLFFVARDAILLAGHAEQREREGNAKRPADHSQQNPRQIHTREFWHPRRRPRLAQDQESRGFPARIRADARALGCLADECPRAAASVFRPHSSEGRAPRAETRVVRCHAALHRGAMPSFASSGSAMRRHFAGSDRVPPNVMGPIDCGDALCRVI